MPNSKDTSLSSQHVRQKVDLVMDRWFSYPSFSSLFDALMAANSLSAATLGKRLTNERGQHTHDFNIRYYRRGDVAPPYSFLEALLATNALNLDPGRIQPAAGENPPGDQRVALFTAAGLIEVTPASIHHWNQEVLANFKRILEREPRILRPAWGDLMTKLLSFHLQGGRLSHSQLASHVRATYGEDPLS